MAPRELRASSIRVLLKIAGWLLVVHGIVCLLGALLPFYIPVHLFYYIPIPFFIKLAIVLVVGAVQVVLGVYLAFERVRQVRWHWLALIAVVIVIALLIYPLLNYFFGL
jgi:hypothetical protein